MKHKLLNKLLTLTILILGGAFLNPAWGDNFVINKDNFTKPNSGSGYAAYDGTRTISNISIVSSNVMINNSALQFKKNGGYLSNSNKIPGNITKITLSTTTGFTIYVGTTANPNTTTVTSGNTISGNYTYFKVINNTSSAITTATITVEYTPTHTLTYSATNGSIGGVVYNTSTAVASGASVAEGGKVTLTAQPADGYEFSSWEVSGTGSSLSSTTTNPTTFTMGTANATVTANFTATGGTTTYSVTYNANGATSGSVPTDNNEYEEDDEVTVLGNTGNLAKTGNAFSGWNTQADGLGTDRAAGSTFNITANTTLYAKWTPYTITAQSNNNTYGTVELSGSVITGSPASGYRYATPAYTVSSGSATVEQDGNEFSVTPTSNCTVTINFEAIPTHTATFSVNGSTSTQDFAEGASITFPSTPADVNDKKFVGWTTSTISGTTDEAPSFVTSATMGTSDVTYYAVFADVTGTTDASWTETAIGSLTSSDIFVIVGNNGSTYALPSADASSSPSATSITIKSNKIDETGGSVANNLKWNISGNSTNGYTFYPNGSTTKYLYVLDDNKGVRVGTPNANTTEDHTFTIANGYITGSFTSNNTTTYRYVGIYNSSDWRCYNNTTGNIANQSFAFYKYIASSATYANYCTSIVITYSVTYDANGATSGDVPEDDTAYEEDDEVTVLGNTGSLAKTGYAFGGWNTESDGSGTTYAANATFNIAGNTTLYAKWNLKTITGLSYTGTPTKTTYSAGDSFDPTGLTVTASYNDESQEDVTESVTWTPDPLTKGTTSVTGTYMEQTVQITGLTVKGPAGSISITADNPVNIVTAGGSDDLALAYDNLTISSNSDFEVQFYDANDDEISDPDWIEVTVEDAEPSGYKVSYEVTANDDTSARSAYFKVYATDDNSDLAYSNKVTITQAARPVTPPTINLDPGVYNTVQSVTITTNEDGGTTYYTTDGSNPTNESTPYTDAISITKTTTLKAITYKGDNYSSISSATYTIFVVEDGVFDFVEAGKAGYDYGSGVEMTNNSSTYVTDSKTWTSGNVTMVTARVSGSGYRWWSNDNTLRFYSVSTATFSVPDGYAITEIVTTGANFDSADKGEISSDTWTGLTKEVKLTATGGRNIKTITVTYVPLEAVTVGTAGYATYASDNALDFTDSNIKAYIAITKGDGTGVNFTQINKVPANTGVLLYKDGGATEEIPVFDGTGADATTGNKFVRGTGGTVATDDGDNYNYILNNGSNGIGFYRAHGNKVAANRAYISIPKSESASLAKDFISMPGFDDDPTGVNDVIGKTENGRCEIYNLAGQRINKLQKGINIINGKKILK